MIYLLHIGTDYKNGDIRLVGGSYSWQGRVEIYLNGKWGTITDDYTDKMDAHVVCRQLGYDIRCELVIGNNQNHIYLMLGAMFFPIQYK